MGYRLSVDVGGTFTDIVLFNDETKMIYTTKVPSTPQDQSIGLIAGVEKLCKQVGIDYSEITYFIHGTTVATNALLERKGAKTALITTKGFRDVFEIGRQSRPNLYNFWIKRPKPPIPRHLVFEVDERVLYDGEVEKEFDEAQAMEVVQAVKEADVESIAICFMNSYINNDHEMKMKALLEKELPEVCISVSSEILPEIKEYERTCTTAVNAYLMPKVQNYMNNLVLKKDALGIEPKLHVMQSNGGIMSAKNAGERSVHTVFSGPAGGVLGGIYISKLVGDDNVITFDIGGTSTDIVLIEKGQIRLTTNGEISQFPIKVPMIEMNTIAAGGGTIAWIDKGGTLRMGPESAGAMPGPVCYGNGGTRPAVSDANCILGRIDPKSFLGGERVLLKDEAIRCLDKEISEPLGITSVEAASGIIDIVNADMCGGIKVISTQKGYDLREFSLISFGGAGSLHAAQVVRDLGMKRVIVPPYPGNFSAIGAEMAEVRYDYVRTAMKSMSSMTAEEYNEIYSGMIEEAMPYMKAEGFEGEDVLLTGVADVRYAGQAWDLQIHVPIKLNGEADFETLRKEFEEEHYKTYHYILEDEEVTIVNLRLSAIGILPKLELKEYPLEPSEKEAFKGTREVYFDRKKYDTSIYDRDKLNPGSDVMGPAIIEEYSSTVVVLPGDHARIDQYKNIIIEACK